MSYLRTRVISVEEEVLLAVKTENELNNIASGLEKISRLTEASDIACDVHKVSNTITEATNKELFFVEAAGRALASSVGIPGDTITTGLEAYSGKHLSCESFSSFVTAMYKAIAAMLKKVWESVYSFFNSVFGTIPRMRFFIKRLQGEIEDTNNDYKWKDKLELELEIEAFSVKDKLPKFPMDITERLDLVQKTISFYLGEYADTAIQVFDDIAMNLAFFDKDDPALCLNTMSLSAMDLATRNLPPGVNPVSSTDSRYNDGSWTALKNLPTDKTMFVRRVAIPDNTSPIQRANAVQQHVIRIENTIQLRTVASERTGSMNTPSRDDLLNYCTTMLNTCDIIDAFYKKQLQMAKYKDMALEATKDLVANIDDVSGGAAGPAYYKTAISFNTFLTQALIQPCTQMVSIAMRTNRAAMIICRKTLDANKPKKEEPEAVA